MHGSSTSRMDSDAKMKDVLHFERNKGKKYVGEEIKEGNVNRKKGHLGCLRDVPE